MDPSLFGYSVEDFKEEAGELLSKAEDVLSSISNEPENREFINALFRAIHSLKGSAAYAGLSEVSTFSHLYESFLGELRNNKHELDKDVQKLLVRSKDYLEDLIFNPHETHAPIIDASISGSMNKLLNAVGLKSTATTTKPPLNSGQGDNIADKAALQASIKPDSSMQEKKLLLPKSANPAEMDQEDVIKLTLTKGLKTFAAYLKKSSPDFDMLLKIIQKLEETTSWAFGNNTNNAATEIREIKSVLSRGQGPAEVLELRKSFNSLAQAIKRAILSMDNKDTEGLRHAQKDERPVHKEEVTKSAPQITEEKKSSAQAIRGATEDDIVKITITRAMDAISRLTEEEKPDRVQLGKMIGRLSDINKWAFNEDETVANLIFSMEEFLLNPIDRDKAEKISMKNASLSSLFYALLGEKEDSQEEEIDKIKKAAPVPKKVNYARQGKNLPAKQGGPSMRVKSSDLQVLMNTVSEIDGLEQKTLEKLQAQALQLRMVPVGELFNRFRKIVRDISEELGKEIELAIAGESVRLDKMIADKLQEPLLHMVRNSASHGIEDPHERHATGKGIGIIKLAASHEGGQIIIEVSDNGRGISLDAVKKRGLETGLIKDENLTLSEKEIMDLIFKPGFSTKESADGISGRGVGMDIVKDIVTSVQGTVMVESKEGSGTNFKLVLPLTLAIVNALIVREGNCMVGISAASIDRILTMSEEEISKNTFMNKNRLSIDIKDEGDVVPIFSLARIFGGREKEGKKCIILLNSGLGQRIALVVDSAIDRRSLTVKPLDRFAENRFFSSAAVWDKNLVLILNTPSLMEA